MQRRKSVFNNEMEQRFSLRKYTIGLCSVCLGFVTIGMGSQSVKADTVNNVEKSSVVREDKMQDADSATTKPNITPTETKKNEIGSVATTAPKTNTTSNGVKANTADSATSTEIKPKETKLAKPAGANNSAVVNTPDQSKSEDSSAVAPTSERTQLQTSQDSSIKAKENSLNNKSNAMKAVAKFINLNEENNSSDPNSKDVEVKPKESSNLDTNEQNEKEFTWHDTFHWVYADKDDPDNPILHKAEDNLAGKKFADDTVLTVTFTQKDGKFSTDGIKVSQTGPKLNFMGITDLGVTPSTTGNKDDHKFRLSFDYNSIPVPQGYDLAKSQYIETFSLAESDGQGQVLSFQTPDRETTVAVYKRNSQTLTIKYVDDDENGDLIWDPITSKVKEGDTVVTNIQDNLKQLENYILVPNQNLPEQITVGNKAIDPIIVHLKHKTEQTEVTKDFVQSASFSLSGLLGAGLSKSPDSYEYIAYQKLFIKGTQKYDLVTRNFIGDATWDYSHIYQAEGDDDKGSTEAKDLDAINSLGDLDKTYIPEGGIYYADSPQYNGQHSEQYKDLQKLMSKAYDTGVISTQTWLKDGLHADGYYLSEKTSLIFDGKNWLNLKEYQEKVDPNFTWTTTNDSVVMQGDHAVDHINPEKITSDLLPKLDSELSDMDGGGRAIYLNYVPYTYKHHSAQRTINIHLPNGEVKTVSQKADAKQPVFTVYTLPDARNDKLASQETGNWTGGEWAEYDAPVVAGYTASQPTVSAKAVTGDIQNETIDITYVASEHTSHVKLVDNDNKTIQDTPVMGKTGETANVSVTVPKGWQLTQGQELPTQISFNAEGHPDVVVQIEHKTIKVTPDNPKENGTVLPDNPSLHFNGVSHDDLNKTVTREITIIDPTGKKSTTAQTVTFTRGATVDEVTNKVTYDDWSENGKHTFDKVDVPTVPGYTVSGEVPEVVVTPETQSSKVDITYTANAQTATITYIDDTEKKSLGSDKQNGKFNQVITFEHDPAEVIKGLEEKGYMLVSNDFNSNKYRADNSNNVFYVHLKHGTSESSRKDDVNMTVHYVMDDGSKAPSDSKQTVSFTESGIKDNVTGNITWMPVASQTLKDVDSPVLTGYTADIKTANGKVVNFGDPDINVTVHYSANAQTATITYIDDTEKKTLGSDKQNGKFNQVITFEHDPAEVIKGLEEKGYKLVSDNFKSGVKYQNDNKSNSFEVHLVHSYEPVETSQTITETVHYIDANGKPVAPDHVATVVVKVTGTRDKVTDSITWNTPSTGHFDEVISPVVPNMTPDKKLIPSRDVQYGDSDITESVVYTPDEIPSEPEEPNDQGKPNSKTPEKPNKPCNSDSKTSEKSNKSSKEVSKQFGTIAKTTIPEKLIDSRTVDNHVSVKSTAKQELPQTGATTNTGIWTGLVSMIAGLGLVGASKKRKKN